MFIAYIIKKVIFHLYIVKKKKKIIVGTSQVENNQTSRNVFII